MITKCCAAWLILLVVSPFTAPFTVVELSSVIRTIDHSTRPANDFEEWFVNGGAGLDFPLVPVAGEFKLASLTAIGTAAFVELAPAAPLDAPPVTAVPLGRAPTLTVLRV